MGRVSIIIKLKLLSVLHMALLNQKKYLLPVAAMAFLTLGNRVIKFMFIHIWHQKAPIWQNQLNVWNNMKKIKPIGKGYYIQKDIHYSGTDYWLFSKSGNSPIGRVSCRNGDICDLEIFKPKFRNRGFGRKLMEEVIRDYGHSDLELLVEEETHLTNNNEIATIITNAQLRKFYRSLGFKSNKLSLNIMHRIGGR